ncbi:hypothetical protein V6Z12_D09G159500 [Gossypium hirsutum]
MKFLKLFVDWIKGCATTPKFFSFRCCSCYQAFQIPLCRNLVLPRRVAKRATRL